MRLRGALKWWGNACVLAGWGLVSAGHDLAGLAVGMTGSLSWLIAGVLMGEPAIWCLMTVLASLQASGIVRHLVGG